MITSKEIAEKIKMFYNLLYHLDDYIQNKKERKGQLHLSKSISLVLREIISSKNNFKYFLNKEEIDSQLSKLVSKGKIKREDESHKNMKSITPLSFNQKNLNTINLFYNATNEVFVMNYLILEKIFSVIRFCFIETVKKRKKDLIKNYENLNQTNFSLRKMDDSETTSFLYSKISLMKKNTFLKNNLETKIEEEFDTSSTNKGIKKIKSNKAFDDDKIKKENSKKGNVSINISSLINNSYNFNNITSSPDIQYNDFIKNKANLLRNLRWQVRIIDDKIRLSQIKDKLDKPKFNKINQINPVNQIKQIKQINQIKKQASFPLINTYKNILNKSLDKYRKKEFEESTLISENKIDANNIIKNIMKYKKVNYPRTTLYKNKLEIHNKSGIFNYDYRKVLPLFRLSKITKSIQNNS